MTAASVVQQPVIYAAGMQAGLPQRIDVGFDSLYGLELLSCTEQEVSARVPVSDSVKQPAGVVHGGVYASMAEAMASIATYLVVSADGNGAMGLSNSTSFLAPITQGTINAAGRRRHRGRTTWVWDVDITDDAGRLCATSRVTIAVRPARAGSEPIGPVPGAAPTQPR